MAFLSAFFVRTPAELASHGEYSTHSIAHPFTKYILLCYLQKCIEDERTPRRRIPDE